MKRLASTRGRGLNWKWTGSLGLAWALVLALASPADAAIFASLSSPYGRPGDKVVLTTNDFGNRSAYSDLAAQTSQPVYLIGLTDYDQMLAKYGQHTCGIQGETRLGLLTWKGDVGNLTFEIPNVPKGGYFFLVDVDDGAQPPCWRMGGSDGPLTFTVGDLPARAAQPPLVSNSPRPSARVVQSRSALPIVGGVTIAALVIALIWRWRRP
jgi:hypothetical protein